MKKKHLNNIKISEYVLLINKLFDNKRYIQIEVEIKIMEKWEQLNNVFLS